MRFLLLLPLLTLSFAVEAQNTTVWNCVLKADLYGNAQHFLYYSQDSWDGMGFLKCEGDGGSKLKLVEITFNGADVGVGVGADSKIMVTLNLLTQIDPEAIEIYEPDVRSAALAPEVTWHIQRGANVIEASIQSQQPEATLTSLREGSLYVR